MKRLILLLCILVFVPPCESRAQQCTQLAKLNPAMVGGSVPPSGETPIFSDGFETGDFSLWTSEVDTQSNFSVQGVTVRTGSYAAQFELDNTTDAYVIKTLSSTATEGYLEFYIRFNDVTAVDTANGQLRVAELRTAADGILANVNLYTAEPGPYDIKRMNVEYGTDGGLTFAGYATLDPAPSIDTWYKMTIYYKIASGPGANDGALKVWWGGNLQTNHNITTIDNDTLAPIGKVLIGIDYTAWSTDQGIYVYWDDVAFYQGEP